VVAEALLVDDEDEEELVAVVEAWNGRAESDRANAFCGRVAEAAVNSPTLDAMII